MLEEDLSNHQSVPHRPRNALEAALERVMRPNAVERRVHAEMALVGHDIPVREEA